MRVLFIGNYENDQQQSMQRFAELLRRELPQRGVEMKFLRPPVVFGRIRRSAIGLGKWLGYLDKFFVFPFVLRATIAAWQKGRAAGDFMVHLGDHANSHYLHYLRQFPTLVTCNDLLAIRSARGEIPEHVTGFTGRIYQRIILHGLGAARHITCISEATRADVLRLTPKAPEDVDVTYMGQNFAYHKLSADDAWKCIAGELPASLVSLLRSRGFVLHVGGNQWYKNRLGAIRIFGAMRRNMGDRAPQLLMVGKPFTEAMRAEVEKLGLSDSVSEVCNASNEALRAFYAVARCLIFPSLEEGFGWPIAEALACSCRVLTTGKRPMNEVGGDAALYCDPRDVEASGAALEALLSEDPSSIELRVERGHRHVERFATEIMIAKYLELYRRLVPPADSVTALESLHSVAGVR